ncbi:amino acid ABC transporter substrate-binding protein [Vallitalea okinawensis]|uniref:amino acid ABC transporter substrate-binding protein n=1 Tax=Vallitalea okinawensis TaxID=2078660 RepID=UPI000CFDCFC2|nr:amino acid ABC transporter substrate-binding protein [Vallitalea okinawensis]
MKRKFIILPIILLFTFILSACSSVDEQPVTDTVEKKTTIVVGTGGSYPPYTFVDEKNNLTGFDVEVWEEIGRRLDMEIDFTVAAFSGLFGMLDNGQIDTIANQITITDERLEKYDFTAPYVYNGAQLVVHKDSTISSLEHLKGKKVGVSLGSNYEQMLRAFDSNNELEIITYESYSGALQDVALGRIDAVLDDMLAGKTFIEESGMDLKLGGDPVEEVINAFPFVKNEDNAELLEDINEVMTAMAEDGTLTEISLKYFPIDITKK